MQPKPKVLAAVHPRSMAILRRALGELVALIPAHSLEHAVHLLRNEMDIALIVGGAHFDDSRMLELLEVARREHPAVPFVCCRILGAELKQVSAQSVATAASAVGCPFLDLPEIIKQHGREEAIARLRAALLSLARPVAPGEQAAQ